LGFRSRHLMMLYKSNYHRASIKASIICAMFGLLVAALISAIVWGILGAGLHEIILAPWFRGPVLVGIIVLFVSTVFFGFVAGDLIYRFGLKAHATPVIGIALAWTCLIISVLCATSVNFVAEMGESDAFNDYILRPAGGIIVIGLIPAFLLGLVYSTIVSSELRNT
jgi:hypothetical protein